MGEDVWTVAGGWEKSWRAGEALVEESSSTFMVEVEGTAAVLPEPGSDVTCLVLLE